MNRLLSTLGVLVLVCSPLAATELATADRDRAIAYLEKTRDAFLQATQGLSEAQWNFKPSADRWSVGEVAEHVAAAEAFLLNLVQEQVLNAPARTEPADVAAIDQFVLTNIPDRSHKVKAPEPLIPNNRFGSPGETREQFKTKRAEALALLKKRDDLREHAVDSPLGHKLDAHQWLLFVAAHSERHTKQIAEVKADPNFPKR